MNKGKIQSFSSLIKKPVQIFIFCFRVASEDVKQLDLFDWGGCGCMSEYE